MNLMTAAVGATPVLSNISSNLRESHAGHSLYVARGRATATSAVTAHFLWALTPEDAADEFRRFLLEEQVSHLSQFSAKAHLEMAKQIEVEGVQRVLTVSKDMTCIDVAFV